MGRKEANIDYQRHGDDTKDATYTAIAFYFLFLWDFDFGLGFGIRIGGHDPLWKGKGRGRGPGKAKQSKARQETGQRLPRYLTGNLQGLTQQERVQQQATQTPWFTRFPQSSSSSSSSPSIISQGNSRKRGGKKPPSGRTNNKPVSPLLGLSWFFDSRSLRPVCAYKT